MSLLVSASTAPFGVEQGATTPKFPAAHGSPFRTLTAFLRMPIFVCTYLPKSLLIGRGKKENYSARRTAVLSSKVLTGSMLARLDHAEWLSLHRTLLLIEPYSNEDYRLHFEPRSSSPCRATKWAKRLLSADYTSASFKSRAVTSQKYTSAEPLRNYYPESFHRRSTADREKEYTPPPWLFAGLVRSRARYLSLSNIQ